MITPKPPSAWAWSRRAFARSSRMPRSLESSTSIGAAGGRLLRQRRVLEREAVELVDLHVEDVVDAAEVLPAVVVGDLEHRAFGSLDQLARRRLVPEDTCLDAVRRRQQAAHQRVLLDDLGV